ncbi:site-specific integrase [Streptomyces sp.]|uniref:site-specific integrase n=1 Tax=Streptomyces sp. TaxID=1931 RepID=UPI002D765CE0|nr:site-specific integrase [Streptomyces sp.]HET6360365.1 site-specific integrase [Streptomyces sp.]
MAGKKKRRFGRIRKLPSGRFQARYLGPDGVDRPAPQTSETVGEADDWLAEQQTEVRRGDWADPDAGAVNVKEYALQWVKERRLSPTTEELYRRLLRLHVLPTFGGLDLDEITPPRVRSWRSERLDTTSAETTIAKAYRLLKAIMETASDDELIRRNPCRIRGAGKESAEERPTATVAQVDALADALGPRWRLMVYVAAYGPARPEEQAAMRCSDVDLENAGIWVGTAEPEPAGPRRHQIRGGQAIPRPVGLHGEGPEASPAWYAEKKPDGLLFVGERGKPFRRSTFGRKWRRARAKVGLPDNFRFYDLRHTGHTLSTQSGATLKDTMVRAGQSSERAALIYQHSNRERQKELADGDRRPRPGRARQGYGRARRSGIGHATGTRR